MICNEEKCLSELLLVIKCLYSYKYLHNMINNINATSIHNIETYLYSDTCVCKNLSYQSLPLLAKHDIEKLCTLQYLVYRT